MILTPIWWTGHFFVLASEPWKYDVIHVDTETGIRYWLFSIGLSDTVHSPEQVYQVVPEDWSQRDGNVTWSDRIRCIGTWTGGVAYAVEPAGTEVDYAKMDALTRAMTETVQTGDIYSSAQVNEEIYYSFELLP